MARVDINGDLFISLQITYYRYMNNHDWDYHVKCSIKYAMIFREVLTYSTDMLGE